MTEVHQDEIKDLLRSMTAYHTIYDGSLIHEINVLVEQGYPAEEVECDCGPRAQILLAKMNETPTQVEKTLSVGEQLVTLIEQIARKETE